MTAQEITDIINSDKGPPIPGDSVFMGLLILKGSLDEAKVVVEARNSELTSVSVNHLAESHIKPGSVEKLRDMGWKIHTGATPYSEHLYICI